MFTRTAFFLSYLWEALLLPFHAARLARLRLTSRRRQYELKLALDRELTAFQQDVARMRRMERDLAASNLRLAPSRQAAAELFHNRLLLMRRAVVQLLAPDAVPTP